MQKTIFISCFFNLVARNILYTDVFKILSSRNDLKIILLVPTGKKAVFEREFGGPTVVVEEIQFCRLSRLNLLFHLQGRGHLESQIRDFVQKNELSETISINTDFKSEYEIAKLYKEETK